MHRYLWILALPLFWGCAKDHNIRPATLDYLEISRETEHSYHVRFASDADLINLFKPEDAPVGGLLRCTLSSDNAQNENNTEQYVSSGLISAVQPGSSSKPFVYESSLIFVESINEGRSSRTLKAQELQDILSARQSVSCAYRFTAYGFKAYYSDVLRIPVRDVLRELDKGH